MHVLESFFISYLSGIEGARQYGLISICLLCYETPVSQLIIVNVCKCVYPEDTPLKIIQSASFSFASQSVLLLLNPG